MFAQDRVRQCKHQRQLWSTSHPRWQCLNRQRQWWSASHLRQQCFKRQERLSVAFVKTLSLDRVQQLGLELLFVVEVFRALSQDRVQQLVMMVVVIKR